MEFVNFLLQNHCVARKSGDIRLFVIELHCNTAWVIAKMVPNTEEERIEYTDIHYKLQNTRTDQEMNAWANGFVQEWDN
jgi:hypothetical protein